MCEVDREENHYRMSEVGNCRDLGNTKEDHLTYQPEVGVAEKCQVRESRLQQADRRVGIYEWGEQ